MYRVAHRGVQIPMAFVGLPEPAPAPPLPMGHAETVRVASFAVISGQVCGRVVGFLPASSVMRSSWSGPTNQPAPVPEPERGESAAEQLASSWQSSSF